MSSSTIRRSSVGSLFVAALAVTIWAAVAQAGPTPTPAATPTPTPAATPTPTPTATPALPTPGVTPTPAPPALRAPAAVRANSDGTFSYDAIFVAGPQGDQFSYYNIFCVENTVDCTQFADACSVNPEAGILAPGEHYVIRVSSGLIDPAKEGGTQVWFSTDCPLGSGMLFFRETTILPGPSSPTPTPIATPTPTPTATPSATPIPTPTATPTATPTPGCEDFWPVTSIVTIAKGQSAANNAKVSHLITGNIIDPAAVCSGDGPCTAHRIPVCAGTEINVAVMGSTDNANIGRGAISCDAGGCFVGAIHTVEKYRSVSADGKDTDRVTLLPQ